MVRDSSPPEATFRKGRAGSPRLAASMISSCSRPAPLARARIIAQRRGLQARFKSRLRHPEIGKLTLDCSPQALDHPLTLLGELVTRLSQLLERGCQILVKLLAVVLLLLQVGFLLVQ